MISTGACAMEKSLDLIAFSYTPSGYLLLPVPGCDIANVVLVLLKLFLLHLLSLLVHFRGQVSYNQKRILFGSVLFCFVTGGPATCIHSVLYVLESTMEYIDPLSTESASNSPLRNHGDSVT